MRQLRGRGLDVLQGGRDALGRAVARPGWGWRWDLRGGDCYEEWGSGGGRWAGNGVGLSGGEGWVGGRPVFNVARHVGRRHLEREQLEPVEAPEPAVALQALEAGAATAEALRLTLV